MTNNTKIELYKNKINELEVKLKYEEDKSNKIKLMEELLLLRRDYTKLLVKKRPMLLAVGLSLCIFWGISLMICIPPFIVRGKKRDINEEKIKTIQAELSVLKSL